MRRRGSLPIRMPFLDGKQGLVELRGAGLTNCENAPNVLCCSRISKIKNNFCYKGNLDGQICYFKIDTGSDVSILNEKFIESPKKYFEINNSCLRYPTGESFKVKFNSLVLIELGSYKVEIPVIVANISDDCILGIDFLQKINLEGIFESHFGSLVGDSKNEFSCSRVIKKKYPIFLRHFSKKIRKI